GASRPDRATAPWGRPRTTGRRRTPASRHNEGPGPRASGSRRAAGRSAPLSRAAARAWRRRPAWRRTRRAARRRAWRAASRMRMLAGTTGYSYKTWVGPFYPEKTPASAMLRFYAERFPTLEINNTFYRMPAPELVERWAADVPEGFLFSLKASRFITHIKRLKEIESSVAEFIRRAS